MSLHLKIAALVSACLIISVFASPPTGDKPPTFKVDANWPQPLPNNWILGQVSGVATDANDHIWIWQLQTDL